MDAPQTTTRLISFIVPVYRGGEHLVATLDSLRAQTYPTWECICVDDGSGSDDQARITEQLRADGRIRLICQRNTGICGGRNRGLESLRGAAFCHLDQDDLLPPDALKTLETAAQTTGASLILGRWQPFPTDQAVAYQPCEPGGRLLNPAQLRQALIAVIHNAITPGMNFPAWNKLYDRATFGDLRFLPERYGDDTYYTPAAIFRAPSAYLLNATTYYWRVGHPSGSHGTCTQAWIQGYTRALLAALDLDPGKDYARAHLTPANWILHYTFYTWIATGRVRTNPELARTLRTELARLLDTRLPLSLRWRLRLWAVRLGAWSLAKHLFHHKRASARYHAVNS